MRNSVIVIAVGLDAMTMRGYRMGVVKIKSGAGRSKCINTTTASTADNVQKVIIYCYRTPSRRHAGLIKNHLRSRWD